MTDSPSTLDEFPGEMIVLVCKRCDRRTRYFKRKIMKRFRPDAPVADVLRRMAACIEATGYGGDVCEARFEAE